MKKNYLENIKAFRTKKGISQSQMADRLGFTQNNYSKIERGQSELTVDRLYEIAEILEVSIFQILVDKDSNKIMDAIRNDVDEKIKKELYEERFNEFRETISKEINDKILQDWQVFIDDIASKFNNENNKIAISEEERKAQSSTKDWSKFK